MSNFFDEQSIPSVERVTLVEDILLPEVTTQPLTLSYLEKGNTYKTPFTEYKDMKGKFSLKIMTPMITNTKNASTASVNAPSKVGNRGHDINCSNYTKSNFITLIIPKHILMNFTKKVPKGTEFVIASINGSLDPKDIQIIGIFNKN